MVTKIRHIFRSIFVFLLVVFILLIWWGYRVHHEIHDKPLQVIDPGYLVWITPGISLQKIAYQLSKEGVLKHPDEWILWVKFKYPKQKMKAGEYLIKTGMTAKDFTEMVMAGRVLQHPFTIVEGWTFERLMQLINNNSVLTHTLTGLSPEDIMKKIGYPEIYPEGRFLPETYFFPRGTTDIAFLQRAYRMLEKKLNKAWENRDKDLPLKTPYEALILASIIEKESSVIEEYNEIAGVYIRRLLRNMPLQADPTVVYGVRENYSGQLTGEHLKTPSDYNTYLKIGLPPTPIALPGERALQAAMHPKDGDTLYFVARPTGSGHVFSRTLEEHLIAVAEYRKANQKMESLNNTENKENKESTGNTENMKKSEQ